MAASYGLLAPNGLSSGKFPFSQRKSKPRNGATQVCGSYFAGTELRGLLQVQDLVKLSCPLPAPIHFYPLTSPNAYPQPNSPQASGWCWLSMDWCWASISIDPCAETWVSLTAHLWHSTPVEGRCCVQILVLNYLPQKKFHDHHHSMAGYHKTIHGNKKISGPIHDNTVGKIIIKGIITMGKNYGGKFLTQILETRSEIQG